MKPPLSFLDAIRQSGLRRSRITTSRSAQLHQRLNQVEAAVAENIPPLPLPGVADSSAGAGAA